MHTPFIETRGARRWPQPGDDRHSWCMPYSIGNALDGMCAPNFIQAYVKFYVQALPTGSTWFAEVNEDFGFAATQYFWLYLVDSGPSNQIEFKTADSIDTKWSVSWVHEWDGPGEPNRGPNNAKNACTITNKISGNLYRMRTFGGDRDNLSWFAQFGNEQLTTPRWDRVSQLVEVFSLNQSSALGGEYVDHPEFDPPTSDWSIQCRFWNSSVSDRWVQENEPDLFAASGRQPLCGASG